MNNYKEITFDNFMQLVDDFNMGEEKKFASDIRACCGDIVKDTDYVDFFTVKKINVGGASYFVITREDDDPVIIKSGDAYTADYFTDFFNRILGVKSVYANV